MQEEPYCFWHCPDTVEEAAEARRLGGFHRRKRKSVSAIYDFHGLRTVADIQAFLETLVVETLTIENSINRNRTLTSIATAAAKLLEVGELADRIEALEAASRVTHPAADPFDDQ